VCDILAPVEAAVEFVHAHAAQGGLLIVGGTVEAADDLARAACSGAMLGVYRLSLAQRAAAVAEPLLAATNRLRLDALGATAVRTYPLRHSYTGSTFRAESPVSGPSSATTQLVSF
jgi:hypothetical protein